MYHYIRELPRKSDPEGIDLSVTPDTFAHQLDVLKDKGYHTITFAELANTGVTLPANAIILSFDDGYQDAYDQAFPILHAHGMKGTFYIVTGFIGKPGYVTWDELRNMSGSGMEIAAHTVHHLELSTLSEGRQRHEIVDSITELSDTLGIHIWSLAYPFGKYNADSMQITRNAGISFATTTHEGVAKGGMNLMELPRIRIKETTDFGKTF